MKKSFILILLILLEVACNKTSHKKFTVSNYEESPIDFFEKIELIPLETVEGSLLGGIDEIRIANNKIYILDENQLSVVIFSIEGKFLSKIHKVGQGPGEYPRLCDFGLLDNGGVELLTAESLLQYDENGEFLKEIKLPYATHYFHRLDDENIALYHSFLDQRISIFNTKTSTSIFYGKKHHRDNSIVSFNTGKSPFFKFNGKVYLNSTFTNDVFKVTTKGIEKAFTFFPNYPLDLTKVPKQKDFKSYIKYVQSLETPVVLGVSFGPQYRFATFFYGNKRKGEGASLILYDIEKQKEHFIKMKPFHGGVYRGWFFDNNTNNVSYGTLEYDELKGYSNKALQDKISCNVDSLYNTLTEESNPTLVRYYFK